MSWLALSASCEYLCYGSTAIINILILSVREPSLYVKIWRLQTSDSEVYMLLRIHKWYPLRPQYLDVVGAMSLFYQGERTKVDGFVDRAPSICGAATNSSVTSVDGRFTSTPWNTNVSSPSTCESQYCGEPPWPSGSVLGLRPPGLKFRSLCLEDSVISFISPPSGGSPGPV